MFIVDGLEQSLLFLTAKPASCTFVPARVLAALTSLGLFVQFTQGMWSLNCGDFTDFQTPASEGVAVDAWSASPTDCKGNKQSADHPANSSVLLAFFVVTVPNMLCEW